MNSFLQKYKKLARLKAARKQLPKSKRMFFITLLVMTTLHFQAQLLEQTTVHRHAAQEGAFVTDGAAAW
jgi:hypothetical protein